jgi:hypothetical protein
MRWLLFWWFNEEFMRVFDFVRQFQVISSSVSTNFKREWSARDRLACAAGGFKGLGLRHDHKGSGIRKAMHARERRKCGFLARDRVVIGVKIKEKYIRARNTRILSTFNSNLYGPSIDTFDSWRQTITSNHNTIYGRPLPPKILHVWNEWT